MNYDFYKGYPLKWCFRAPTIRGQRDENFVNLEVNRQEYCKSKILNYKLQQNLFFHISITLFLGLNRFVFIKIDSKQFEFII
jgi:hypothetical protein